MFSNGTSNLFEASAVHLLCSVNPFPYYTFFFNLSSLLLSLYFYFYFITFYHLFTFAITNFSLSSIPSLDTLLLLASCSRYSQIITEATHFQPNCSPSCIHLIFTDKPNLLSHSGVHASLYNTCHHQIIFTKIDLKTHLPPSYKRKVWNYSKAEEELIKQAISNFNLVDAFFNIDTNKQVDLLTSTLLNIFRNFIPLKAIACNYNDPPWITIKIETMLRKKNRLYRKIHCERRERC